MRKIKLIRYHNHKTADGAALQQKSVILPKPSNSLPNFKLIFKEREWQQKQDTESDCTKLCEKKTHQTTVLSKIFQSVPLLILKEKQSVMNQQDQELQRCMFIIWVCCVSILTSIAVHSHSSEQSAWPLTQWFNVTVHESKPTYDPFPQLHVRRETVQKHV